MRMLKWIVSLSAIALIPSAHAIALSTPLSTNTQNVATEAPQPTAGVQLNRRGYYDQYASELPLSGSLHNPFRIGWLNTKVFGTRGDLYCGDEASAMFHRSNSAFSGMQGCCIGNDCAFATLCYNKATIHATPSITESDEPFGLLCTKGSATQCGTWTWPGSFVRVECVQVGFKSTVFSRATWSDDDYDARIVTQVLTTIDEKSLSYIASTILSGDTDASSTLGASSSPAPSYSNSFEPSQTTSLEPSQSTSIGFHQSTSTDADSSHSSTSPGAIAGGVVGGLAGGAAIAAGFIFFFMRRKKNTSRGNEMSEELRETGYQEVPQNQSHHSSWLMPHVAQPEASYQPEPSELSATSVTKKSHSPQPLAELPERAHR